MAESMQPWPPACAASIRDELLSLIRTRSEPLDPRATGRETAGLPLEGIRAVLFDVYGTLFISGTGDVGVQQDQRPAGAVEQAFADLGWTAPEPAAAQALQEDLQKAVRAGHRRRRAAGCDHPEIDIRACWQQALERLPSLRDAGREDLERLALAYELRVNPVWPMPGAPQVLQRLREQGKIMGIVSNAQFYTPLLFPALMDAEVSTWFDEDCCAWSYRQLRAKPSPKLFEPVVDRLRRRGVAAAETLYIGNDMRNDVWTAARCGMRTALFAGDARSLRLRRDDPDCRAVEPDAVLGGWSSWTGDE